MDGYTFLASYVKLFQHTTEEELLTALSQIHESPIGQALEDCLSFPHLKRGDEYSSQHCLERIGSFFNTNDVAEETLKTQQLLRCVAVFVSVFLQVNCIGPLMCYRLPSESYLDERHATCEKRDDPSFTTFYEKKMSILSNFFMGHPDDRVGKSQSTRMTTGTLLYLSSQLQCDGEDLSESIRGVAYLWSSIRLCDAAVLACSDPFNLICRFCLLADVAFIWQQSLESSPETITNTLQYWTLYNTLSLATLGDMLSGVFKSTFSFLNPEIYKQQPQHLQLTERVSKTAALDFFQKLSDQEMLTFFLQISVRLSYFGYPEAAVDLLNGLVARLAKLNFCFSSCLGKRRQHQQVMIPQLILQTDINSTGDTFKTTTLQKCSSDVQQIDLTELDPSSDILPCIHSSEGHSIYTETLTTSQVLVLLSLAYTIYRKSPKGDEVAMEQLRAVIERCLNPVEPENPLILTSCLWFRCQSEFHRSKTHDRALCQLTSLSDEFTKRTPSCFFKSLTYVFMMFFPFRHLTALYLGKRMMETGLFMSARDMFVELCMWEDSVECLIAAGRSSLALDLIRERLAIHPTPRLLCCLGDVLHDPKYYQQAWELSKKHYTRAKRSLGHHYVAQNKWKEASEHYKDALNINPCFVKTWFSLGCCLMRTDDLESALHAFSRVVILDPNHGEAWANAAALHFQKNNLNEAFTCIKEALKYHRTDWRVWDTYIKIAVKLGNSEHCIHGLQSLLELGYKSRIEDWVFMFLSAQARQIIRELSLPSVSSHHAASLQRELNRICDFFQKTQTEYISDNITLYMCFASIYEESKDGEKEFSLRLKELRCAMANLTLWMHSPESRKQAADSLCKIMEHMKTGYQHWCLTSDNAKIPLHQQKQAEELLQLCTNLRERLESYFPLDSDLLKTVENMKTFFKSCIEDKESEQQKN